jgi:glucose-6-phosphate isomerase
VTTLHTHIFQNHLEQAEETLAYLKNLQKTLPLFQQLCFDYSPILDHVERLKKFDDIIILGTGGSSLGGQALTALRTTLSPRLHFLDNIDAFTFNKVTQGIVQEKTAVIAISKSGNTAETLIQLLTCLKLWDKNAISQQFLIVSEPSDNAIRQVAREFSIPCLDHPPHIGGRYSVFTVVGLLPALLAGQSVDAFREGALNALNSLNTNTIKECAPLMGALVQVSLMDQGVNQTVLIPYCDRLALLSSWFCQLWAESIGKRDSQGARKGSTPVRALGAVDQHSQLQLYLDGPQDKFFTFLTLRQQEETLPISSSQFQHPALMSLDGKTMGQLMNAEQRATLDTLRAQGAPVREIAINTLTETDLGELMMHFILETLAAAFLLKVNPFDQPAVEDGKKRALAYLQAM